MKRNRTMLRIFCLILVFILVLGLVPVFANAADNVASVTVGGKTTGYATVQAAVDAAAASNGTVKMLADAKLEGPVTITSGTLTLDLAGKSIRYSEGNALEVDGATLTVTDSSTEKTGVLAGGAKSIDDTAIRVDSGSVTINGGTLSGYMASVRAYGGTVVINNMTTDDEISNYGGNITINGGVFNDKLDIVDGKTFVNGGTFTITGSAYMFYLNGGSCTVNGGVFNMARNYGIRFNDANSDITLRGGVFKNGIWMSAKSSSGFTPHLHIYLDRDIHFYDATGAMYDLSDDAKSITQYVVLGSQSPGPRKMEVSLDLTNLTSSNKSTTLNAGEDYVTTFIPAAGYDVPTSLRVKINGSNASSSKYTYTNGTLTIPADKITGDIVITASAIEKWTYSVSGITSSGNNQMTKDGTVYTKTYTSVPAGDYEISVVGSSVSSSNESQAVKFSVSAACDVTVTYDPSTGELTVTGDNVKQEVVTHRVIYFDNSKKGWSQVKIYAWNDAGAVTSAWSGDVMTLVEGQTSIYYYVLPIEAVNVIFNDGSAQTGDLTLPGLDKNMYEPTTNTWSVYDGNVTICSHASHDKDGKCVECGTYVGHSYVNGKCSCGLTQTEDPTTRVVYFQNTAGWSTPYIYAWTTTNGVTTHYAGTWSGSKMTAVAGVDGLFCYTLSVEAVNVIFNNGSGTQTSDLILPTDGRNKYDYSTKTWSTYVVEVPCDHPSHGQDGKCTTCGAAVDHSYTSKVTAPTCAKEGYTTYTCSVCKHSYTGNTVPATGNHNYVDGKCTTCGQAKPVVKPTLGIYSVGLSLKDEVIYNVYFTVTDTSDVVEMGLLGFNTQNENGTISNADYVTPGYTTSGQYYVAHSNGIPAKNLGDDYYYMAYAKLSDGTYAYSPMKSYNAVKYANTILGNASSNAKLKAVVVAMLNYGAAAQVQFDYKTDALMNAGLTAEQKALVKAYDESMVNDVLSVDSTKAGEFATKYASARSVGISLKGAFAINYYLTASKAVDSGMTLYYWTEADYKAASTLTTANATGSVVMDATGTANQFKAAVEGISAKRIDETIFVVGVYESNGVTYSTGVLAYSLGKYCEQQAAGSNAALAAMAQATAVYGYYAKAYFGN